MDQSEQSQQPVVGVVAGTGQMASYAHPPLYHRSAPPPPMVATAIGTPAMGVSVSSPSQLPTYHQGQGHQQFHNQQQQQQQQQLQSFWTNQMQEIEQTTDFKNHSLPLARIKKIMKADEDVRMISAEAPVIFAKACEMFILELTLRSWIHTEENKRRTLQKNDIAAAISRTDVFDFLVDIIPRDELKEEGLGVTKGTIPMAADSLPYYFAPPPAGMMPVVDQVATLYAGSQQPMPPMSFVPWLQPQQPQDQPQQEQSDT